MLVAKAVSRKTFKSIIDPPKDMDSILTFTGHLKEKLPVLTDRYLPWISQLPLHQGMKFEPTWKSIPTVGITKHVLSKFLKLDDKKVQRVRSIFTSFHLELAAYADLLNEIHALGDQWSSGILWAERTRFAFDPLNFNKISSGNDLDWFESRIGPMLPRSEEFKVPPITGKLGCSLEGAGKRRIFAIGNYINQRLLRPIHDWVASILRRLPSDGTFDQERPLRRLFHRKDAFSYDLTAATDRWPLVILFEIMQFFFDRSFASAVVNSALAFYIFLVPFVKRKWSQVSFLAGQPLGYYGSWPLFALSHHHMVWLAADIVYPGRRFTGVHGLKEFIPESNGESRVAA